jgi:hypothetical protein
MRMSRRDHIGASLVDLAMNGKGRDVHRSGTFDDIALAVDADEVRGLYEAEVHPERIDPESVRKLRIARCDVAGHSLAEAIGRKDSEATGETLLPVLPFLGDSGE